MTGARLYAVVASPIGDLLLTGDEAVILGLHTRGGRSRLVWAADGWRREPARFAEAERQIDEYFRGDRTTFDLPIEARGTPFQHRVWSAVGEVGYGETISYGSLAERIGMPRAARAVGAANGANPLSILIPCHRLVGADGDLVGYSGGLESKRRLLALEAIRSRTSSSLV